MERWTAEFRSTQEEGRVKGYASVFGQVAQIRSGLERIDPIAFDRALRENQDVALLVNHEGLPLARTSNGSLILTRDGKGLVVNASLPDTSLGRDVRTLLDEGLLSKMSFGFIPKADRYDQVGNRTVRTITDLDLFDVSIVTFPAYSKTSVSLRNIEDVDSGNSARSQAALIRARFQIGEN